MALEDNGIEDADPVVASYDIYIKPHLKDGKKVFILQFPNRDSKQGYSAANSSLPLELRMKEKSGILELDVPLDTFRNYDREKGLRWGGVVSKSDPSKGTEGGSHGLAGGFGIGTGQSTRARGNAIDADDDILTQDALMWDFAASIERGRVLTKQTLGGQAIPKDSTTPQYMIGAFRNQQLHLTPVNQIVQMRPQFHHIDAEADLERRGNRESAMTHKTEPRAIHMIVKATMDGEEETTDTMAERIRAVQEEQWTKLKYVDEDSTEAWEAFHEHLFVDDPDAVPKLVSSMTPSEYLYTISAPRAPAKLAKVSKLKKKT